MGDCYHYYERCLVGYCHCCALYLVVCYAVCLEPDGWLKAVCSGEYLAAYDACYCFWC